MSKKIGAIIQARMGSERLPGKVLKKIGNKTILEIIINRLKKSKYLDEIIVATTKKQKDDKIIDLCKKKCVNYYRGSEDNVLDRYIKAAEVFNIDIVIRVTADNPLTSPLYMDKLIKNHIQKKSDYTYTNNLPLGISSEVVESNILKQILSYTNESKYKEHVTYYILKNSEKFKINKIDFGLDENNLRLTVDTYKDYKLMRKIYRELGDFESLSLQDVLQLFYKKPDIARINSMIEQKDPDSNNNSEISIIIRTHNSERFIERCLKSVFNQTLSSNLYEIVLIDDESIDNTMKILKKYDKNIRLFRIQKSGAIPALNVGINKSKGKYIIILDSDDTFSPTILELMYKEIKNYDYVYCDYFEKSDDLDKCVKVSIGKNILNCAAGGIMIKKEIIKELGYYREDLIFPEYDILIKLSKNYSGKYIKKPLFTYNRHDQSITSNKETVKEGMKQLKNIYGKDLDIREY